MRSISVLLVLLFLACAFGQSTFDTKIAAHWSLPCTSTSSLYSSLPYNDPSACRLNPAEQAASYLSTPVSVTWGVGVYGASYASTLTFDPYDSVTLKLYNGNVAQSAVPIGVLTHFNFPINCYDDCNKYIPTNFVLGLYVNVQVGTDKATYKGDFTMFLDETPNVDGRNPLSAPCSYNPHETSWDAFTGNVGYTSDYPCCPYYTAKAVPNGAISLNGPCSDRLKFTTVANFNEFIIQGTKYTLVIAGFSSSNTAFNADVTFFTSQENQSQQAYIWAYVTRKCTDSSACNDNQQCTTNVCNTVTGLCEYSSTTTNGLACTDPKTTYYSDVCTKFKCKSGTCYGSILPEDGSCVNSAARPTGKTTDCSRSVCKSGFCTWSNWRTGSSCTTGPAFTDQQCQRKICNLGSCRLGSANTGNTCTPASSDAQAALAAAGPCNSAKCIASSSGTCRFAPVLGGSCTQVSTAVCNKRLCKSKLVNTLTVGTCRGTATGVTGSCQNTGNGAPAAVLCKQRKCVSTNGIGSCQVSNAVDGGSCVTGVGALTAAVECKARTCLNGACAYTNNNNQGSCVNPALTLAQCWKRKCNAGTCGLTINTNQGSCTNPSLTKKECFKLVCNTANGVCESQINTAQGSCTGPTPQECKKRTCNTNTGACELQTNGAQGSCTNPSLTKKECFKIVCNSGACSSVVNTAQGSCTGPAPQECKKRTCNTNTGACELQTNGAQGSCTNPSLTKKECFKIVCNSGACSSVVNTGQGSCAGPQWKECFRRVCNTNTGACESKVSTVQGSCYSLTAQYCSRRLCNTASGACESSFSAAGGSCSGAGLTAVECKKRVCNGLGACIGSVAYTGGSCSNVLTTRKACYKRVCNSGTCNYTPSAQGSCQVTASGTPVAFMSCRKRMCTSGSCGYQFNDAQGSCQTTGAGVAVAGVVCKKRACSSGSCIYQNNDAQGSCLVDGAGAAVAARDCKRRSCASGLCVYTENTSGGGSCTSSWVGNSQTPVAIVFCNKRTCDTRGTCKYAANTAETAGSCRTDLAFRECYRRQCRSTSKNPPGSCGYVGVTSGSCTGVGVQECKIRQCQSDSTCNYNSVGNGGSCTGAYDSSSYAGMSASCTKRVCNNGACSLATNNLGGTCNTGKTSNDYTCFKQRCKSKTGVSGGTCSTSASPNTRSCNAGGAYTNTECRVARCDGTGSCRYNYNSYGPTVACTSLADKVCAPERCNGQGTCVYRNDLKEGSTGCLATDSTTVFCTDSKCQSGECVDVSDINKNASTICKTSSAGEDTCKNYYCLYKNPSSTSNKLGTCVRLKDPSQVSQKCSSSAYSGASTEDARCFNLLCDSNGVCQKQNRADGVYCATPPNTETNNGYGCSQYVCRSGTCNTAAAVPIKNGTNCAGWLPCDPSTAGCLAECQRFICFNGVCQVDYYKENQNCTYIKYLTARSEDGETVVEEEARDSENGGVTANECTQGKCYQGRCVAVTVQNGTACGNRTKYNDLCYGDYCNAQGRCVNTGRRNCQGVLPLPSVCWDVTCEASSGDCVLRANGVVDCSCIFDCSACTAKLQSGGRKLSCWWCTGDGKNAKAGCFNRKLPGQTGEETPPPQGHGKCYKDNSPCAGDNGLSGGQIAGIVVGILGLTSLALLVIALLILAIRYFAAPAAPPANASLTDLAFDKNVKNNVFYKGANLEMFSSVYAEPKFITT